MTGEKVSLEVSVLYAGRQCGQSKSVPQATWIDHEEGLAEGLGRLGQGRLGRFGFSE